ncbi:MAG: TonB-dependent receptor [bacterium]|nr:TonB-dependent receptor [bacterium]
MKKQHVLKFLFLILILILLPVLVLAQKKISGKVVNKKNRKALSGATVAIPYLSIGTVTNEKGFFRMEIPYDTVTLSISYIGFETRKIKLNKMNVNLRINAALKPVEQEIEEVTVVAEKERIIRVNPNTVSSVSISPKLIEKLPNFGEVDIMRAFQLLPGISGTNETSSGLYIRGGTPDQNLILFDGMSIYHVDHFYGFFSAFNANAIDDVELHKGGFPAEFGGRTSGVLDIKGKPADMQKFNFGIGLSLLSLNVFTEVPIIKDKLSVQASFRRSYTDILRTPLFHRIFGLYNDACETSSKGRGKSGKQSKSVQPDFYFYDLNAKLSFKASEKDLFTVSFYNGKDNYDNSRDISKEADAYKIDDLMEWGNIGTSFRWKRKWSDKFKTDISLSYSNYFSVSNTGLSLDTAGATTSINLYNSFEDNNVKDYSLRLGTVWNISENNTLKLGTQITYNDISYEYIQNDTLEILNKQDYGVQSTVYIQDEHIFFKKLRINAGIRGTYYNVTEKFYFEPRFSAIMELPYNFKLKGAVGLYNQFISRTIREDVRAGSRDFWILSDDVNIPVSSAIHYIGGINWEPKGYLFGAEYFYKDMNGLSEFTMRYTANKESVETEELFYKGDGTVSGFELLAQKKNGKTIGWLAYTYSNVIHTFPELNNAMPFYALHDQTHEFKAVLNQRLGKWDLSATWIYATGTPYTAPEGTYELTLLDGTQYEFIHVSNKNSYRLPAYHRLDISGKFNFNIGKAKANVSISVFNIYNRQNVWYRQYENDYDTGQLMETDVSKLGITPNFSFRVYLR